MFLEHEKSQRKGVTSAATIRWEISEGVVIIMTPFPFKKYAVAGKLALKLHDTISTRQLLVVD